MRWFVAATLLIAVLLGGCQRPAAPPAEESILCLVAASADDAVGNAAAQFTKETGIRVRISADSSSRLATQISQQAPGDLFLSANQKWVDFLDEKKLVAETTVLLGNRLVLVVPLDNPAKVRQPTDLTGEAVRHLALAGDNVPAGTYARQALKHLGLLEPLTPRIASGDNVRVAMTYVERGEAEAGIVYATDALLSKKVSAVYTFPEKTHEPIVYPLVLLRAGAEQTSTRRFYDYLKSDAAKAIFTGQGFVWQPARPAN